MGEANGSFDASAETSNREVPFPLEKSLAPVAGAGTYAISPINECYPSEFSLHYMALFLLSSLVRYRPQTWMHAISRSVMRDLPADDQALSLIEQFLDLNMGHIPEMIPTVLNPS
jgi:YaaC-like Protein